MFGVRDLVWFRVSCSGLSFQVQDFGVQCSGFGYSVYGIGIRFQGSYLVFLFWFGLWVLIFGFPGFRIQFWCLSFMFGFRVHI